MTLTNFGAIDDFRSQMDFKEIVPISALQGNNVSRLIDILSENLEEGFQYFPADQITDHPERFLVSEMIREKVLHLTREENSSLCCRSSGFYEAG